MQETIFRLLHVVLVFSVAGCAASQADMPRRSSSPATTWIASVTAGSHPNLDIRTVEDISVSSERIEAPAERAWTVLPRAYRELGIPVGSTNGEARVLGHEGFRVQGELGDTRLSMFLRCGRSMTGSHADEYQVAMAVLTQVLEAEQGTVVSTHLKASATPRNVSGHAVQCASTGRLEERIAQTVELRALGVD